MINQDELPHKQWLAISIFLLGVTFFPVFATAPKVAIGQPPEAPPEQQTLYLRADCPTSFTASSTLASIVATEDLFGGLMYKSLIKCFAEHESSMCQIRLGDNGQSRGLLHYYRWWEEDSLWGGMCVGKYGFDDIDNDRQQVLCADYLIQEDFNFAYRWTTIKFCLTN